jgi:hypothetical protein
MVTEKMAYTVIQGLDDSRRPVAERDAGVEEGPLAESART